MRRKVDHDAAIRRHIIKHVYPIMPDEQWHEVAVTGMVQRKGDTITDLGFALRLGPPSWEPFHRPKQKPWWKFWRR